MPALECIDEEASDRLFDELCKEVDLRCNACEAIEIDVKELEEKLRAAYAHTARSIRGIYDQLEIANHWLAMVWFAASAVQAVNVKTHMHQICGIDTSVFSEFLDEASERFMLHCPAACRVAA